MLTTIDFGEELQPAVQQHLSGSGISVQRYIRNALRVYNKVLELKKNGHTIGCSKETASGSEQNFKRYNLVIDIDGITQDAQGRFNMKDEGEDDDA